MASGYEINTDAFETYGIQTAELFVELYPWYYMPTSVHTILLHGADVIRHAILPIGQLSEESQESQNKHYKNYREHHTRKISRVKINEDLINMLLVSSDPLISSMRNIQPKKLQTFSDDAKLFIIMPED
ncbi:unnamed protein product [Macrosiphum euphorbiae]|uniref:Uncharacterized protein n=1 Tax=Macrosiphum euphorbiae TaxID=13131 RepID=A0AAV0WL80_9HEMI|nr:unnamed protein product [Macrosiphum euphorbiae]